MVMMSMQTHLTDQSRFSEVIRAIRKQQDLTQRALAKMLDVSPGYVGQWECGLSKPSSEIISRLCQMFNLGCEDHIQRLAYAENAPAYIKQSILMQQEITSPGLERPLSAGEARIIALVRKLPSDQLPLVTQKLEAWVCACNSDPDETA